VRVSKIDRILGITVVTSADFGDGPWMPGMELHQGRLWAGTLQGEPTLAFEYAPGKLLWAFTPDELKSVSKVASGLNVVVECEIANEDGSPRTFTVIGPRGRMKKAFAHVGKRI
jgi:hypothetical protein